MRDVETVPLSLTGPGSHTIVREPGVGSLTIGPSRPGGSPPGAVVGVDDAVDWSAFDPLTVPAGYPWPRWLRYEGNDSGFIGWSVDRPIEGFDWTPHAAVRVDASRARIEHLALDCTPHQFPQLREVELRGQLTGLPSLSTWPALERVIAWNVEEATGKRLRTEIWQLTRATGRVWRYASVSRLRRPEWFVTSYGPPFAGWPVRSARVATGAYRAAEAQLAESTGPAEAESAIRTFVRAINTLPDIETTEREDAGEAVRQLAGYAPVEISADLTLSWFHAERDF